MPFFVKHNQNHNSACISYQYVLRPTPCHRMSRLNLHLLIAPFSRLLYLLPGLLIWTHLIFAQEKSTPDLTTIPLEKLMQTRVTLATRYPKALYENAAAISILTRDQIMQSGYEIIPDLLRMIPGFYVGQFNANKFVVGVRGFPHIITNKIILLIDGRSVYAPVFSNVFWDVLDITFDDIQQIEIIRGPSTSLWGTNAVNGVINIITRRTENTHGGFIKVGSGNYERKRLEARYGSRIGANSHYRIYTKMFDRLGMIDTTGQRTNDKWRMIRFGGRIDWYENENNHLTLTGEIDEGIVGRTVQPVTDPVTFQRTRQRQTIPVQNHYLLARWQKNEATTNQIKLTGTVNYSSWHAPTNPWSLTTVTLDWQQTLAPFHRQNIIYGVGYRYMQDHIQSDYSILFNPERYRYTMFSVFTQHTSQFWDDKFRLTVGIETERNSFTGWEFQPTVRAIYLSSHDMVLWSAISRGARTPSRAERHATIYKVLDIPTTQHSHLIKPLIQMRGSSGFNAEYINAVEFGTRFMQSRRWTLDMTWFYHDYRNLRSAEIRFDDITISKDLSYIQIPVYAGNHQAGQSAGMEVNSYFQPASWWQVHFALSYTDQKIWRTVGYTEVNKFSQMASLYEAEMLKIAPLTCFLNVNVNFSQSISCFLAGRYVDSLSGIKVRHYTEMDLHINWQLSDRFSICLSGRNLLHSSHCEYRLSLSDFESSLIERTFSGALAWHFQ